MTQGLRTAPELPGRHVPRADDVTTPPSPVAASDPTGRELVSVGGGPRRCSAVFGRTRLPKASPSSRRIPGPSGLRVVLTPPCACCPLGRPHAPTTPTPPRTQRGRSGQGRNSGPSPPPLVLRNQKALPPHPSPHRTLLPQLTQRLDPEPHFPYLEMRLITVPTPWTKLSKRVPVRCLTRDRYPIIGTGLSAS